MGEAFATRAEFAAGAALRVLSPCSVGFGELSSPGAGLARWEQLLGAGAAGRARQAPAAGQEGLAVG